MTVMTASPATASTAATGVRALVFDVFGTVVDWHGSIVAEAAKERRVLAIGNVVDLQAQFPDTMVASALWNMQPTIDEAVKVVAAGTLFARDYARFSSLRLKGSSLSPLGTFEGRVPAGLMDRVKARATSIVSGAFVVRVDPATPRSSAP